MITSLQKKTKLNPMLLKVIIVSILLHVVAGFVAGIVTIATHVIKEEAQFEEPPAVEQEEPPPDVKVEIKPQKIQQQPLNQLKMKQIGNITVANVDVNLPGMSDSFTVSAGLGNVGGGSLLGGAKGSMGMGLSEVSVFGLRTKAERILFMIDASKHMLTDEKGGLNSYNIIKQEITDMVGNLSAGTLFNVAFYDRRQVKFFKPQLVPAGAEVHQQLKTWIGPVNSDAKRAGLPKRNKMELEIFPNDPVHESIINSGARGNENATLTQLALEQKVDAIFIITGYHRGFDRVRRNYTDSEQRDWDRKVASKDYQEQLAAHNKEKPQMEKRVKAELERQNAERKQKGLPPRVLSGQWGVYSNANDLGLKWNVKHPGFKPVLELRDSKIESYFRKLIEEVYTNRNATEPSINVVLFLAGNEELKKEHEDGLKRYVRMFGGKSRVIRGQDEIKSARSAKDTKN